ncbi:MAG: HlyD family efflux transporter periplasmic adaptor subunit [Cyclobacteriaceae bacterium]
MKKNWRNNIVITTVALLLVIVAGCGKHGDHAEGADIYSCPMHPTVISDRPGSCPVCGMDLVQKGRPGEEVKITEDLSRLIKSPNEIVVASIKTIKGEFKKIPVSIVVQGIVTYDTRNIYTIPTRIGGRLERVYLKYAFQKVSKGQKVAEIYSPELLTAQRELLFLLENDSENSELITSAKEKLSLLGASSSQIAALIKRKEVQNTFSIYSPFNGYIIANEQKVPTAPATSVSSSSQNGGSMNVMGSSGNTSSNNGAMTPDISEGSFLREGSYVSSGQTLFKVVNPTALRVELNVPSSQGASIRKGDQVELNFGEERKQNASVDFVQPFFNEGEAFVNVRVYTKDVQNLHIGHLTNAVIKLDSIEGLWIPKDAMLDLGLEKVVFIKDRNVLKPKTISAGVHADGWIEVKQGLSSSDEIASNAQYLVDSESFIKTQK